MKKILLVLFVVTGVLLLIGILTLKAKMPLLSDRLYTQVDLGVRESPELIRTYYKEIGYVNNLSSEDPKSGPPIFEGGIDIEHIFTQQEINSWLASWEEEWADLPFQNTQIRINPDGTVEASATISVPISEKYARILGYSDNDIDAGKEYVRLLPNDIPLYAKGSASIIQNDTSVELTDFKIANFTLPESIYSEIGKVLAGISEKNIKLSDETDVRKAIVKDGGVEFEGRVPALAR